MMHAIRIKASLIWDDIRKYRNLELYLVLLVIIALFIFDIFGAPNELALTEALLAGIAVLIYSQLDVRHKEQGTASKIESLAQQIERLRGQLGDSVQVFPHGRSVVFDFAAFMERAQKEVIIIGISLTAFRERFTELPAADFKDRITKLLAAGVIVKCYLLDPKSSIAEQYAQDRNERIQERVQQSLASLREISAEFSQANLTGRLEIFTYSHLPYCYLVLVDPDWTNGAAIVSPYLYKTNRADTPIFHLDKAANPILFEKYRATAMALADGSTQYLGS